MSVGKLLGVAAADYPWWGVALTSLDWKGSMCLFSTAIPLPVWLMWWFTVLIQGCLSWIDQIFLIQQKSHTGNVWLQFSDIRGCISVMFVVNNLTILLKISTERSCLNFSFHLLFLRHSFSCHGAAREHWRETLIHVRWPWFVLWLSCCCRWLNLELTWEQPAVLKQLQSNAISGWQRREEKI